MTLTAFVWTAVAAGQVGFAPQPLAGAGSTGTLVVPYIAQPALLCGGAAMAMVERFWGRRGVYASDFAYLVREDLDGIVTRDLQDAARARGWNPHLVDGAGTVRELLRTGVPVIALIEVAPGRNHYVVLLSWSEETVVYHDPAIAPSRSQPAAQFAAQWEKTGRWAMTIMPAQPSRAEPPRTASNDTSRTASASRGAGFCHTTIQRAHRQLGAGHDAAAASLLQSILSPCEDTTYVRRALAGVRFRQKRWSEAAQLAADHVADDPDDGHAWSLLGASRYLAGDEPGALDAWNALGEPRIDLVNVEGLEGTRFAPVADALGLEAGDTLDVQTLDHARRRLNDIPALLASKICYRPVGSGLVELSAQVLEREWSGGSLWAVGETALRSVVREEVAVELVSPTGGGERLTAAWTWPPPRRRLRIALDAPAPLGLLGTLHLSGQLARETFLSGSGGQMTTEERRTAEAGYADWLSPQIHMSVRGGVDRWKSIGDYGVARVGVAFRPRGERLALSVNGAVWVSPSAAPGFSRFGVRADWRSHAAPSQTVVTARVGMAHVSPDAPRMEWPSAGIQREGSVLLRAHKVLRDDVVAGSTLGRTVLHGGVTADRWLTRLGFLRVGAGLFADGAAVWHSHRPQESPYRVDVGAGLRIGTALGWSLLRLDLAQALVDSGRAVSVSLSAPWPG